MEVENSVESCVDFGNLDEFTSPNDPPVSADNWYSENFRDCCKVMERLKKVIVLNKFNRKNASQNRTVSSSSPHYWKLEIVFEMQH